MKKIYSIAMLLMLVASVSFFSSCNKDDDNGVNMGGSDVSGGNGGGSEVETKTYTGTLKVFNREPNSEEPSVQLTVPVDNQSINMSLSSSAFGLSIEDLVLEIIGMGPTPSSNLSISGVPYTVSSSDADLCVVDYVCDVQIDISGTYATVTKIKGSFSKSSNVMNLAVLATGSLELLDQDVYISVVCPSASAGE
ncbi:MAG: hypothetical protein IAC54_04985 [Bacteroidetes bacterium]|uniref:DUF4382 domain-containing protein n=1 Tax=Candidatus Caccoplasma merdipullorum TaxID=2840718 RepID=A0A9D9E2Q3_9BACT|nr:hypothetical protein [Candidatus Caccoplasma merdipullorum]